MWKKLRRWLGWRKYAPEVTPKTRVLFVLQANSPKSFAELCDATGLPADVLSPVLHELEATGRVRGAYIEAEFGSAKLYWVNRKGN